ncbi:SH3 domain-containing protein [Pelistega europaea]|uniref:SH3 domain-containing protein n=1 Tax=Pelistega europaea TaxID=106147 RepID=A0A7Y4L8E5_9BURK|nr:SH3 domain-containing protein [Pelistega europaea]NOL48827.1 SH3 domain-containing protein [Pelistega europaea]
MKSHKLVTSMLTLSLMLTGCVTMDNFLGNLGLSPNSHVQQMGLSSMGVGSGTVLEVTRGANVRAAPDINSLVVGTLSAGQRFWAAGSYGEWIAIGDQTTGQILGYIHQSLVGGEGSAAAYRKSSKASSKSNSSSTDKETSQAEQAKKSEVIDLDAIPTDKSTAPASSSPAAPSVVPSATTPSQPASSSPGSVDLDSL